MKQPQHFFLEGEIPTLKENHLLNVSQKLYVFEE